MFQVFDLLGVSSMNKFSTSLARSASLALATLALGAPLAGHATTQGDAVDSCISAFVAANLPKEQPVTVRKKNAGLTPIEIHSRAYKIKLSARGVRSGKYLARGTCIVDREGQVISLDGKPLVQKQQVAAR
jgi:hypothetical protein